MNEPEEYYPEQYAAAQIAKYGWPLMSGMMAGVLTGFAEHVLGVGNDMQRHDAIDSQIWKLQSQNDNLKSAEQTLHKAGATVEGVDGVIADNKQQITELNTQKAQVGNETVANVEFLGLPVVLGVAVAVVGLKRALKQNKKV